jgi:mRNA-degrading endonuclease RelE of RelBE toxin-antitoxin system
MWEVKQTRRFARQYKKLQDNTATDVDLAVDAVQHNPEVGEKKKGDLATLLVFKFRSGGQLYLLGYTREENIRLIYLEAVGPMKIFTAT